MRTSRPYAAPTENRLSTIAVIGMTTERNVASRSRNASPSTKRMTHGMRDFICSLKSCVAAVSPATA